MKVIRFGIWWPQTIVTIECGGDTRTHVFRWGELGCRRTLSQQQNRYLLQCGWRNRRSTIKNVNLQQVTYVHVSDQTIRSRLHESGITVQHLLLGLVLTAQHRTTQLAFAREHQSWPVHHWSRVHFTNKNRFTLSFCGRCERVWKSCDKHYAFWFESGWPVCIGSSWGTKALIPLTHPHVIWDSGLGVDPQRHHLASHQEHAQILSHCQECTWGNKHYCYIMRQVGSDCDFGVFLFFFTFTT